MNTKEQKEKKKEYMRMYRAKNKIKLQEYNKKYMDSYRSGENREAYLEGKKRSYKKNKSQSSQYQKLYYESNKKQIKDNQKKNYEKNKEQRLKKNKEWRENNFVRDKQLKKAWYEKNKHRRADLVKKRKKQDSLFKLKTAISSRIRNGIKSTGFCKKFKSKEILGCTYEEFKNYIESKWMTWMNWDNYGLYNGKLNYGWDLDHIIPLCTAKTEEEVIRLNHHTNFQPLCSKINRDIKWKKQDC